MQQPASIHRPLTTVTETKLYMIGDFFNFNKKETNDDDQSPNTEKNQQQQIEEEQSSSSKSVYVDDDPVEKIFNFFFGEKEEAPMGMARFGSERFPGKEIFMLMHSLN